MSEVNVICEEVLRNLSSATTNDNNNVLFIGSHNASYGNANKAQCFLPVYQEYVKLHHILAWQEVDQEFLELVAESGGNHTAYYTVPNSRGQAIGFTIHNRLELLNTVMYSQLKDIMGVPDLRPALRLDLCDKLTGLKITVIGVHYKSNHGGQRKARPIRYQQAKAQVEAMRITKEFAITLGDFNQALGSTGDTDSLVADGFSLIPPHDRASTHASGNRLDGLFAKNVPPNIKITCYRVRNFWRNSKVGTTLSDHALVSWKIIVQNKAWNSATQ